VQWKYKQKGMDAATSIELMRSAPKADEGLDVTGIDIGTLNLGLCRMRMCQGRPVVVWWTVIDLLGLENGIAKDACAAIPNALRPWLECFADCPQFAIEQQPFYNTTMRMVAHALITYFHTVSTVAAGPNTFMSAAQNKLKPFEEAEIESYAGRKASAVRAVATMLNDAVRDGIEVERHTAYAKWFAAMKKRDDAADAYLHAYYALVKPKRTAAKTSNALGKLSVKQLQEQLRERQLPVSGKKQELRERLRAAKQAEKPLTLPTLRKKLKELGLETRGTREELEARLPKPEPTKKKRVRDASPKPAVKKRAKPTIILEEL
jgi:hypothetical protein